MKKVSIATAAFLLAGTALAAGFGFQASGTQAAAARANEATTYEVDPVHSVVIFRIEHMGVANYYGRFNDFSGEIEWDENNPAGSRIEITIEAESIDTNNENRDSHLRSPDFFNVREFPEINFTSTNIEVSGDNTYRVTGELDLHGVTREITVDLEKTGSGTHLQSGKPLIGFETHFELDRSDYRMRWGIEEGVLGDEVGLIVSLEAIDNG